MKMDNGLNIDWSKFKSDLKGRYLSKSRNSYIEFCKMLNEVDFELISNYSGAMNKVELIYKFDNSISLMNLKPSAFKSQTYKCIINFKKELVKNGDKFVEFIGLTDKNNLIAKIQTFDGGEVEMDIGNYNSFNKGRQDFYNKLKEVGGYTRDCYKNNKTKINIFIDDVKLYSIKPNTFLSQKYKVIIKFKNKLKENNDEFIRFVGLTNGGNLVAKIKTFDKGKINIDIGAYERFSKSRQDFYDRLREIEGHITDCYKNTDTKIDVCINGVRLNIKPSNFKTQTYKAIVNFKNNLIKNKDEFIEFIGFNDKNFLVAKIKTFDGGIIEIDIASYNSWNKSRQDFYNKLREINGHTTDHYKNSDSKMNICVDGIKLNLINTKGFKRTYESIIGLKNRITNNNDQFIKFVGLTNSGDLIVKIRTFDGGIVDISKTTYNSFNRGRENAYNYCKEKGCKILSPYINSQEKILIDFNCGHDPSWVIPSNLKQGIGCPICSESKGERVIRSYLEKNNIEFSQEHRFDNCKYKRSLPFDFFIPEYNLCIEFDGIQHFEENHYFGGKSALKSTQTRDRIKNKFCEENNIDLLRIPYYELDNIDKILDKKFNRLRKELKEAC